MVKKVNWLLVLIMSIIFGAFGVDRFILGQPFLGILKLITLGGFGIWWLVDVILIAAQYPFKNIEWDFEPLVIYGINKQNAETTQNTPKSTGSGPSISFNLVNRNGHIKINWLFLLIVSIFLGALGIDRFIMGHVWLGLLKLITGGGFGIWWLIDIILIAVRYPFKNIEWT